MLSRGRRLAALAALSVALGFMGCHGGARKDPQKAIPAEELYRQAEALMTSGKYGKAMRKYEQIDTARNSELRAQVHLRLADAYFAQGNILALAEAQSRYRSYLNFFPLSDQAPYAQYRYALCLKRNISGPERDQTATHLSVAEFQKVQQLYPNSSWVEEADERLTELDDHLTRDNFLKARFYYSRKGYRSAVSRLTEIVESNPDFGDMNEVLFYLGMSLRRGGQPEEGNERLRQLIDTFPDSRYAKKAARALQRPAKIAKVKKQKTPKVKSRPMN